MTITIKTDINGWETETVTHRELLSAINLDMGDLKENAFAGWVGRNGYPKAMMSKSSGEARREGLHPKGLIDVTRVLLRRKNDKQRPLSVEKAFKSIEEDLQRGLDSVGKERGLYRYLSHTENMKVALNDARAAIESMEDTRRQEGAIDASDLDSAEKALSNLKIYGYGTLAEKGEIKCDELLSQFHDYNNFCALCEIWATSRKNHKMLKSLEAWKMNYPNRGEADDM